MPGQEEIIVWLRSQAGELWSLSRIATRIESHDEDSGAFADVIRDGGWDASARWPEPFEGFDLDDYYWGFLDRLPA